ncbi:MAG: aminotransferase class I/II-fold pyridoxal phosphate-dependent enzyme [Lachnospiraceae bacterium]|nr:aminotransferase class I/II-fold pyridoxal phosphate-dependent enzyme [Lachnospiraceae bacterium]
MSIHGGDVYRNHVDIDFSVNVNPLGAPECVKEALHRAVDMCGKYPDMEAERLGEAVSTFLGMPKEYLLFGNGASELFMAIVHGINPKKVVIPLPSFYGYEYAAKAVDSEIIYYEMNRENNFCMTEDLIRVLTEDVDLLFLANPNNPIGNLLEIEMIKKLLLHCKEKGIYVVADECFIEFCGNQFSLLPEIRKYEHLILVRAFTKIFAIPGVRLGYLVCKNKEVHTKIAGQLPEWNLSCFAQEAGCICAKQTAFIEETKNYIEKERQFLAERLLQLGCKTFSSVSNFIMLYSEKPLYEKLLKRGILIRDCSNFKGLGKGFYRIAVKSREENELLLRELETL